MTQIFNNILRRQIGTRSPTVEYISAHPHILFTLLKGWVPGCLQSRVKVTAALACALTCIWLPFWSCRKGVCHARGSALQRSIISGYLGNSAVLSWHFVFLNVAFPFTTSLLTPPVFLSPVTD